MKKTKPLEHPVNALQHTPIYKMHRYYARRPWNVFEHLLNHYSEPGEIVLDPFCGGGVTLVEGLILKRKVVGVDLNPLATFITELEVMPLDIHEFQKVFAEIIKTVDSKITKYYKTTCIKCGNKEANVEWYEWSNIFECPFCKENVIIDNATKISNGNYRCTNVKCNLNFKASKTPKIGEKLIRLKINCNKCNSKDIQDINQEDIDLYNGIEKNFDKIVAKEKLWFPKDKIPHENLTRENAVYHRGVNNFYNFFSVRNLLTNAYLLKIILNFKCSADIKKYLLICFSSSLLFTNRMSFRTTNWRGGNPQWSGHSFWIPDVFCEVNVYNSFVIHYQDVIKAKEYSNKMIGEFASLATNFQDIKNDKNVYIINQSSHNLPLDSNSIDLVLTDPPFGGNVNYAEISNFFMVWLNPFFDKDGIINSSFEAIQTRHLGFPNAKDSSHYEEMLFKIFKECHRVLKHNGYMVMTFHNKDIDVWMSLHKAANRAGFKLPNEKESENRGIIYQPPIKNYTQTFHQRYTGSMLGDFILTFQRLDVVSDENKIKSELSKQQENTLENKILELIHFHGGADDNTIMTTLIPTLNELGILHKVSGFDWVDFLNRRFTKDKKTNKWFSKDMIEPDNKTIRPIDYIQAEEITKDLIIPYLKEKNVATIDNLLTLIYTKLVNSHRPGIEAIHKVLERYCIQVKINKSKKIGYSLRKEIKPLEKIEKQQLSYQTNIFGGEHLSDIISHNKIIELISHYALEIGHTIHIGTTEQRKERKFKSISTEMKFKEDWGISSENAFKKIKEIDLLILEKKEIIAGFEVTTSIDTAREAINDRFRDLFSILPNTKIITYVVVKDEDYQKALTMINSQANIKDKLHEKIKVIKVTNLIKSNIQGWIKTKN